MNKLAIRLLTLAMLSLTLAAAPIVTVVYAAPDNDPPPPDKVRPDRAPVVPAAVPAAVMATTRSLTLISRKSTIRRSAAPPELPILMAMIPGTGPRLSPGRSLT